MKFQLGWLREHVDLPEDAAEVARRLTSFGLAVEGVEGEGDTAVLDIDVTTNRVDAMNHVGVARELAAALARELRLPDATLAETSESVAGVAAVSIEAPDLCARYAARVVRGVSVRPSPAWMATRLEACGIRPINTVVDVTNYVLLELGHPLHAFDLALLEGSRIVVRRPQSGEVLRTLDGSDRALEPDDLLIADGQRPVALAGVMGGANSEIRAETTDVLLESAWFSPQAVRRTSRRLGLHTEASHRFERGADVDVVPLALDRAAKLLVEVAGGAVLAGRIDVHPVPGALREVRLRAARIRTITGVDVPKTLVERVLPGLGFRLLASDAEGWTFRIPAARLDVSREVDLIEEVLRHHGFDQVPATLPPTREGARPRAAWETGLAQLRRSLVASGHHQAVSFSFGEPADFEAWGDSLVPDSAARRLPLANPLAENLSVLRTSLVPALLRAASHALRREEPNVRLFEDGRIFLARTGGPAHDAPGATPGSPAEERPAFAVVATGRRGPAHFQHRPVEADLLALKGAVLDALRAASLGALEFEVVAGEAPNAAPGSSGEIRAGGLRIGWVARVHPASLAPLEIEQPLFAAEVDLSSVLQSEGPRRTFRPLSRYPGMSRDVSILVDRNLAHGAIIAAVRGQELATPDGSAGLVMESFELIDRYVGSGVPSGKVSLTFTASWRRHDRTLTQDEVDAAHARLVEHLVSVTGARLRG